MQSRINSTTPDDQDTKLTSQKVLSRMRADILDGTLPPTAKLRFADLKESYGAGVGTLREALSHLSSEGLVVQYAGKGFQVAPISHADLMDITEVRVDLERKLIRGAIEHGDDNWEASVITAYHLLEKIEQRPLAERLADPAQWNSYHRDFHRAIVAASPSRWMQHFHEILFDQAQRYRMLSLSHKPSSEARPSEHGEIMKAVLARDAEFACLLSERHIRRTADEVIQYVPAQIRAGKVSLA